MLRHGAVSNAAPRHLVLVGAGHAHAQVLRDWIDTPVPGVALSVVSPSALAPYSGMVPGWLAGTYGYEEICIDFAALASAAGATLIADEVRALDAPTRRLHLHSGAVLNCDLLSLNVGSTLHPPDLSDVEVLDVPDVPEVPEVPEVPDVPDGPDGPEATVLCLRPLGELRRAWDALLAQQAGDARPLCVTAVGGGAAGVESLLAVLARLRALQPGRALRGRLVTRADTLLPGLPTAAARALAQALHHAGVDVLTGQAWSKDDLALARRQGPSAEQHLLLWATGAEAHAWQAHSGLEVSDGGFIAIDAQLRSPSHPAVFAVGDCAAWTPPLPKAGVFAVRMGPVLSHNLRAALTGAPLRAYAPQRQVLALLACADGSAVAARGCWAISGATLQPLSAVFGPAPGRALGRTLWRWKDGIDRAFLRRFDLSAGRPGSRTRP